MGEVRHKVGEIVRVATYYSDMICSGSYVGMIVGVRNYSLAKKNDTTIYDLLNLDKNCLSTAEHFAVFEKLSGDHFERVRR